LGLKIKKFIQKITGKEDKQHVESFTSPNTVLPTTHQVKRPLITSDYGASYRKTATLNQIRLQNKTNAPAQVVRGFPKNSRSQAYQKRLFDPRKKPEKTEKRQ